MYENIKNWMIEHKKEFVLGIGFVIVFGAGYGAGLGERADRKPALNQPNYSTKVDDSKAVEANDKLQISNDKPNPNDLSSKTQCKIKGTSSKIYHLPGGAFYDRVTNPAACFNTE